MAGGMMRFGIPKYRLPRDVLDAEVQRILDLGVTLELDAKVTDLLATMEEGAFDAAFLAVGAQHRQARLHPRRRGRPGPRRSLDAARPGGESDRCSAAGSRLRRRQHRDRRRAHREAARRHGGDRRLPTQPRPDAGARVRGRRGRGGGRADRWLSTIKQVDQGRLTIERMELDETGFPQPTGEIEELEADSLVLALGQEADLSLLDGVPGLEVEDGVVSVGPEPDDRLRGIFAGGDMVPAERSVTVGDRPRKERRRATSTPGCAGSLRAAAPSPIASFDTLNTWYYADAPRAAAPRLEAVRRQSTFEEVVARPRRVERPLRGAALHVVRQLLLLRQLLRRLPRQRRAQAREPRRAATRSTSTSARAAASASPSARPGRSRWSRKRSEQAGLRPGLRSLLRATARA